MVDNTAYSGKSGSVLIGLETVYGSAMACAKDLGYIQAADMEQSEEKERIGSIGARNAQHRIRTRWRVRGSIDAVYQHGRILHLALGSCTTAGGSDPYTHTYTEADVIPSFTIQATKSFASAGRKTTIPGCRVDSLRLTAEKGATLKWSSEWKGLTVAILTTTATQTLDDIVPPSPAQVSVYVGADAANPTAELTGVQSFELAIANNLETVDSINSVLASEHVEQDRDYSGKITFAANAATQTVNTINNMLGTTVATAPATLQTKSALKLYWTNGLTPADTLTVTLYGVTFTSLSEPYQKNGVTYYDATYEADRLGAATSTDDISDANWF